LPSPLFNKLKIKEPIIKKISILVFIWSALVFFLNLQYNFIDNYDITLFWVSISLMIGTVIYQIIFIKNNIFVLFEIFIIYISLHLIYQIGFYGFYGSDSYVDYNFLKTILNDQNFVLGQSVDGWPMLHIFTSSTTLITKIDPLIVAKFLPSFISSIIVLPFYLLVYNIYKNRKIALFSCLILGTVPQFVSFEAAFVRETIALFFIILFLYLLYVSKKKSDYRLTLLTLVLIPVIVFSHHFTSLIIILVLSTYLATSKIIPYMYRKDTNIKSKLSGGININMIFLTTFIAIISYWVYHAIFVLEQSSLIFFEVVGLREITATYAEQIQLSAPIVTLRGNITYYGFFFFHLLFSFILLIKFIRIKNRQKIEDTTFIMFFYLCMFYSFLALYVLGSLLFPDRFLPFAWIFGIIPLVGFLLTLKKDVFKAALAILLVFFVIFNVYSIDPEFYTGNVSSLENVATEREYVIAEQFSFPEVYYGYSGVFGAIYDIQGIDPLTAGKYLGDMEGSFNYSTMAVINENIYLKDLQNIKEKSKEGYDTVIRVLSYKNDKNVNKICDLGNLYLLKGVG